MNTKIPSFSSIAIFILIFLLPLVIWLEQDYLSAWGNRLAFPSNQDEPNRHTPAITNGTFLAPTINKALTLTSKDNPVILPGVTTITETGSVTIEPGVTIMVHEYGQLVVNGRLFINGTEHEPVTFLTNELHLANQVWSGILLQPTSAGSISHAIFEHASPALTCLSTNKIAVSHLMARYGKTDVFNPRESCSLAN